MLPIQRAVIIYPDGSRYRIPDDGTWAEAPPFGVQAVVYYDTDGRITKDGGWDDGHVYEWLGEDAHPDYAGLKMGLWMDRVGYYRVVDLETLTVSPEV
jgi:hypothetical protein